MLVLGSVTFFHLRWSGFPKSDPIRCHPAAIAHKEGACVVAAAPKAIRKAFRSRCSAKNDQFMFSRVLWKQIPTLELPCKAAKVYFGGGVDQISM